MYSLGSLAVTYFLRALFLTPLWRNLYRRWGGCIGSDVCRGRSSDHRRSMQRLGREPRTPLEEGLRITYEWIRGELIRTGRLELTRGAAE